MFDLAKTMGDQLTKFDNDFSAQNQCCAARRSAVSKVVMIGVVCLSFTGCLTGPDFMGVAPPTMEQQYIASIDGQPRTELAQWWGMFSDSTLDQLIDRAISQNLDLRQAYERVVESRANLGLTAGAFAPDVDAITEYDFNQRSANARPFVATDTQPFDLFTVGLDATWEIDLFGRIARSVQAAEADLVALEHQSRDVHQTLVADIASSYLQIRQLQFQAQLVRQSLSIQQETAELVSARSEAGISTELDLQQANSFLHRTNARLTALQQQIDVEFNRLSLLLGQSPDFKVREFVGVGPIPISPGIPETGIPADLLRRRPDVRRDESSVVAAGARIGVATADLYPQLSLLGSVSVGAQTVSDLFQTDSLDFTVGPSLRWNIFHFGRIRRNIEIQESRYRNSINAYQQTVLTAVREVEDSLINHLGFRKQLESITEAVLADEKAVQLGLERYKAGKANFQRVLDAQQQQLLDQQLQATLQTQMTDQLIRLIKATGGGWTGDAGQVCETQRACKRGRGCKGGPFRKGDQPCENCCDDCGATSVVSGDMQTGDFVLPASEGVVLPASQGAGFSAEPLWSPGPSTESDAFGSWFGQSESTDIQNAPTGVYSQFFPTTGEQPIDNFPLGQYQ